VLGADAAALDLPAARLRKGQAQVPDPSTSFTGATARRPTGRRPASSTSSWTTSSPRSAPSPW
jgi:hypothetical protein